MIIGIAGPARSGKSTVAQILEDNHGFDRERFASPLKRMVGNLLSDLGYPRDKIRRMIEGDLKEELISGVGVTPRHVMQTLGTEWGRNLINPDLWVIAALARVDVGQHTVFEDVRFQNEADAIRGFGGIVIGLTGRGGIPGDHESEAGVTCDHVINNSGNFADLVESVSRFVK